MRIKQVEVWIDSDFYCKDLLLIYYSYAMFLIIILNYFHLRFHMIFIFPNLLFVNILVTHNYMNSNIKFICNAFLVAHINKHKSLKLHTLPMTVLFLWSHFVTFYLFLFIFIFLHMGEYFSINKFFTIILSPFEFHQLF